VSLAGNTIFDNSVVAFFFEPPCRFHGQFF